MYSISNRLLQRTTTTTIPNATTPSRPRNSQRIQEPRVPLRTMQNSNERVPTQQMIDKQELLQAIQDVKNNVPFVVKSPRGTVTHGSSTMYSSYNCRCEPCREANTQYAKERRQRFYANPDPTKITHGKRYSYTNLGCRCDLCRRATLDYQGKYDKTPTGRAKINARRRAKRALVKTLRTPEQVEADKAKERERSRLRRAKAQRAKAQTVVK